jgi:multicomponent Na+:H+ antiporter subunit E
VRALGRVAVLVLLWLLAWGDLSAANVVSGAAVAVALLVAFPPDRRDHDHVRVSLLGVLRLAGYVARQLVTSNVQMTATILRRRPGLDAGVLAHELKERSDEVVALMTSVIALSPGTMTVDVSRDASTIYVHFLRLDDIDVARASLRRLEELVERAVSHPRSVPSPTEAPP